MFRQTPPRPASSSPSPLSILLLSIFLHLSFSTLFVHAYSFSAPTGAARWATGQPALITIVSTNKATVNTKPTDDLLTVSLCTPVFIISTCNVVATIADRLQVMVPVNSTAASVSYDISNWIVPTNLPAGNNYYVHLSQGNGVFPPSADSPKFQVVVGNTTTPTTTTAAPTSTTTSQTPTATPSSCNDIQEQCVAQGRVFQNATGTAPCSCGAPLILPNIQGSGGIRSLTLESSGGSYVALTVLLLSMLALF